MSTTGGKFRGVGRFVGAAMAAASLLAASQVHATIIGGTTSSAAFVKLSVPLTGSNPANTVGENNFQSPNLFGFDESQNTTLTSDLTPDFGATLASGTTVASHYVFFDPNNSATIRGTVDFDAVILAVLSSTAKLAATDYLANTGVTYVNPSLRGLESGDSVSFSGMELTVDFTASNPGDYVRVLTAFSPGAVPEPGSFALVGLALAGLGLSARRRTA